MSTLRVSTIQDTAGSNSSTPAAIANGICKAWVNFNGSGTVAIRASYNVSSITDNGVGDYTSNFTNALTDANYTWSSGVTWSTTYGGLLFVDNTYAPTTTSLRVYTTSTGYAFADPTRVTVSIDR
jgi:hypothetical protein